MIKELKKDEWKGTEVLLHYRSHKKVFVSVDENFETKLNYKELESEHHSEVSDVLFQAHWENPRAWGLVENDELLAVLEVCDESWNNRLRVTLLWVDESLRRTKIATRLMNIAKEEAKSKGNRALVLETQNSNTDAIQFYVRQGFRVIGFDAIHYTNEDVKDNNVRLEMGIAL